MCTCISMRTCKYMYMYSVCIHINVLVHVPYRFYQRLDYTMMYIIIRFAWYTYTVHSVPSNSCKLRNCSMLWSIHVAVIFLLY